MTPTGRPGSFEMWNCGAWGRLITRGCCRNRFGCCGSSPTQRRPDGTRDPLILVTNRLDLTADLIALAYRHRWAVELFFRWLKCVLSCRHLIAQTANGVTFQVYTAIIASLLLSLSIGQAPTKATYEMVCHYLSGWATEEELIAYLERLRQRATLSKK